jgi:putative ABC transport system permease protein
MKYIGLVLKNARRNKRRTLLTVLSVAIAVFLGASLRAILEGFTGAAAASSATRTVTIRKTGLFFFMPVTHAEAIKAAAPGVKDLTWACWFGGIYKDPDNFFAQFAIEPESYLRMYPEIQLPTDQRAAFLADRTGAIIGAGLARRFDLKIGDRLTLQVGIPVYGDQDYTFTIRGIYTPGSTIVDDVTMLFHWKYLDEQSLVKGQAGWFVEELGHPDQSTTVAAAIDQRFANSPFETKTVTERQFQGTFVSMFGNLNLLLGSIGLAVIITTLFVAGNTMAMSVRERTTEIAVMRTLGFPSTAIFALVSGEAVLMAIVGAVVGGVLARVIVSSENFGLGGFIPPFGVSNGTLVEGLALGALIGVLAGVVPATLAARLKIVDGLRRVA